MKDFRCSNCNRLLAKVEFGKVQIKCPHCRTMNEYTPNFAKEHEKEIKEMVRSMKF